MTASPTASHLFPPHQLVASSSGQDQVCPAISQRPALAPLPPVTPSGVGLLQGISHQFHLASGLVFAGRTQQSLRDCQRPAAATARRGNILRLRLGFAVESEASRASGAKNRWTAVLFASSTLLHTPLSGKRFDAPFSPAICEKANQRRAAVRLSRGRAAAARFVPTGPGSLTRAWPVPTGLRRELERSQGQSAHRAEDQQTDRLGISTITTRHDSGKLRSSFSSPSWVGKARSNNTPSAHTEGPTDESQALESCRPGCILARFPHPASWRLRACEEGKNQAN